MGGAARGQGHYGSDVQELGELRGQKPYSWQDEINHARQVLIKNRATFSSVDL
jgi:hypothetical protein